MKLQELTVPVVVHVHIDTFRTDAERARFSDFVTLSDELVQEAVRVTPLPGGGTDPLQRLEAPTESGAKR